MVQYGNGYAAAVEHHVRLLAETYELFSSKEAKLKLVKENNYLLKRELDTLRNSFNGAQAQMQKLQDSLLKKEENSKSNTEAYVKVDSEEFKRYINCEVERFKELSKLELKQHIEK